MKKIYDYLNKIEIFICSVFLIMVVLIVFSGAIARKIGIPMQESLDLGQLLFAWICFLGADIALRNEKLVGVDLLVKKFSPKVQFILKVVCHFLIIGFLWILFENGIQLSIANASRSFQTLKLSYSLVTLSLSVGSGLMILSTLYVIQKNYLEYRRSQ